MNLKVAYDITILGNCFNSSDPKTGIYRVTEELMFAMLERNDINLSTVGLCGENLVLSAFNCGLYAEEQNNVDFFSGHPDNLSSNYIYKIYQKLLAIYSDPEFQKIPKLSPQSVWVRGLFKILNISGVNRLNIYDNFAEKKFDVFHSPYFRLPSREITQNTPRVITIHDLIPITASEYVAPGTVNDFKNILHSIDLKKDWVTCVSEHTRQQFCEYTGMAKERTFVTPLAADNCFYPVTDLAEIARVRQNYSIPEGRYFICLASQLEPRKNIPHLVECFVDLIEQQKVNDVSLVLVGSQRFYKQKLGQVAELLESYQKQIIFTGYVADEELNALYSGATAFIFPSLLEGFGLPILEAMQCNIPVITSNVTSLPEVAGDAAILVDPQDKDTLTGKMLELLNNETLREELRTKGSARAKTFSWQKCAEQTTIVYRQAVSDA